MPRVIILILSILIPLQVFATAQRPDYLIYKNQKYRLHVNPLEELFQEQEALRPEAEIVSSGNWRGYIATFSIENSSLNVTDITIAKPDPDKEHSYLRVSVLEKVFPNKSDRKMNWYSGLLVVPLGERTGYVHLSYASQYERYLLFRVSKGVVQDSTEMTLDEYMSYKQRQFEVYKQTPDYGKLYKELSKGSDPDSDFDLEGFIFQMGGFTHKIDIPFKSPDKSGNSDGASAAGS